MAMSATGAVPDTPSTRRFAIGANVFIALLTAAALLVVVNWIASLKSYRREVSSLGGYGLSDRTKSILDSCKSPVDVSVLYMPDPENENQQRYITRLQDYGDELERYSKNVKFAFIISDAQRERLVSEISTTFGGEGAKHKEAVESFYRVKDELRTEIDQRLGECQALLTGDTWLADFPLFANIITILKSDSEALIKAADEVKELAPSGGIPKYGEATKKAKASLDEVKTHLEAVAKRLSELAVLSDEAVRTDSKHIANLRQVAAESRSLVDSLQSIVGGDADPVPSDAAAKLKAFADRANEVDAALEKLVRRVDDFARKFPMVRQHPNWATQVQMGPILTRMEVADVLQQAAQNLGKTRLSILGAIDSKDSRQIKEAFESVRLSARVLRKNTEICEQLLTELAARLSNLDAGSKAILDGARSGTLFADRIKAVAELAKQIDALPELKLGSIADQLKEDNTVVVQANNKIRTVAFNEMFPVRESVGGPGAKADEAARTFNGDSALSTAILALTQEKPFAQVMVVSFEPPAPQQRNQFAPPPMQSWIPSANLSTLRKRLEAANFKVTDWNMATTKDEPPAEDGLQKLYIILPPPPPAMPNPFGAPPPSDQQFGDAQREKIRALLENDARMLFLCSWEIRSMGMFGGPPMTPPYGYQQVLDTDWGIDVQNNRRIVWVDPSRRQANSFGIVPRKFMHMPVAGFTSHPVGSPMRGTRFLVSDSCPLQIKAELPKGVTVKPVLTVSNREDYIAADVQELIQIIDAIQNPASNGWIDLGHSPQHGPFVLAAAAERMDGEKSKGRIVVSGCGGSVREDFLNGPVWSGGDRLKLDPPPSENADLIINALCWLQGAPERISRGPVAVPRIEAIEAAQLTALRWFVWGIWPAIVFVPGIVLWYVRRR